MLQARHVDRDATPNVWRAIKNFSDLTERELLALAHLPGGGGRAYLRRQLGQHERNRNHGRGPKVRDEVYRYMASPIFSVTMQVVIGGLLVFATGILIGSV